MDTIFEEETLQPANAAEAPGTPNAITSAGDGTSHPTKADEVEATVQRAKAATAAINVHATNTPVA